MPRISEISADGLSDEDRNIFDRYITEYGPFENQAKIFAQRPPALRHIMGLLLDMQDEAVLPKRYLEIVLVTVSKLNECAYCVGHHSPRLAAQGFHPDASDRILDDEVPGFDEIDHLVRDYAREVTEKAPYMRDAIFVQLKQHFSEAQVFELTCRAALCGFFNRVNDALQINMEPDVSVSADAVSAMGSG